MREGYRPWKKRAPRTISRRRRNWRSQNSGPPSEFRDGGGSKGRHMALKWNYKLFIDNKWVDGEKGAQIELIDPATEEPIGQVAEATANDAIKAIRAARKAFDEGPWPWMKPSERSAI